MKTILKDLFTNTKLGVVGEETNIVDKNGNKLHIGDIVTSAQLYEPREDGTFTYTYSQCVIVKPEDFTKAFLMGLEDSFNEDGTYDELELELAKSYKDISIGSGYVSTPVIILYEEVDDEE